MKLFISYSSKTRDVVKELAADLETLGYDVWFDPALSGGREWWKDICAAIRESDVFVFAMTQEALDSYPCQLEYTYASDLKKRVLPVMIGDVSLALLPKSLQKIQIVDYRIRDKQQLGGLGRALIKLPASEFMPDDIPEPEAPINPLVDIVERVNGGLPANDQKSLVFDLEEMLRKEDTAAEAYELLQKLMSRKEDLLVGVYQRVDNLIIEYTAAQKKVKGGKARTSSKSALVVIKKPVNIFKQDHALRSVAFSPDGLCMLVGGWGKTAFLLDTKGNELQQFIGHTDLITSVAFSPDGRYILTASWDTTARLWDGLTGEELSQFTGHTEYVSQAVFSPDSQYILTASEDKTARLWDITNGQEIRQFAADSEMITSVAFSPNGQHILTGSGNGFTVARLWDVETGRELRHFSRWIASIFSVAFSSDGQFIVTGRRYGITQIWEVETRREVGLFRSGNSDSVFGVAYSPDGQFILTGGADKIARLWKTETKDEVRQFVGHDDAITSVAFSPDGKTVLTGSKDRTARLWSLDGIK